ncbi:MAG: GNAT family N-acetyltransferase [Pseudomonadota bacterium]|nr:GNAT family N-acetyltransferase [Pseudomonadota bacterium]
MIRSAQVEDAAQCCEVIRASIVELCQQDHHGEQARIDDWLQNKTVAHCEHWIQDQATNTFVADEGGQVVGVSSISHSGHLFLLYLRPGTVGKGVGAQLLSAAEDSVRALGVRHLTLESTLTAKGFYERFGYVSCGATVHCLKYEKALSD